MHWKRLEYLRLVIQNGSFAEAATAAGVSQPAISMAMQALEREWGLTLFEKVGRRKVPTRYALLAAQRASDLQSQIDRLARGPKGSFEWASDAQAPMLKAGMAPAAALLYGPTLEQAWRACEPEGLLQIIAGGSAPELLAALQDDELDIVIAPRPRRYPSARLQRHPVHSSTPRVYVRVGHPLACATSLADIERAGWAVAGRAGTAGNVIEEAHRVRRLPEPRIRVQCADYPTLLNLVASSDLLCVVPHPALLSPQAGKRLTALRLREGLPRYEVCMFWTAGKLQRNTADRSRRNAVAVSAVVDALKSFVRSSGR